MYKYLYKGPSGRRHLWVDLITVNRIKGPLIGINDPDNVFPMIDTLAQAKFHKFIIQRPFFRDSSHVMSQRNLNDFNQLVSNLFLYIPLPNEIEFKLFSIYSNNKDSIVDEKDNLNVGVDDDLFNVEDDLIDEHD